MLVVTGGTEERAHVVFERARQICRQAIRAGFHNFVENLFAELLQDQLGNV